MSWNLFIGGLSALVAAVCCAFLYEQPEFVNLEEIAQVREYDEEYKGF